MFEESTKPAEAAELDQLLDRLRIADEKPSRTILRSLQIHDALVTRNKECGYSVNDVEWALANLWHAHEKDVTPQLRAIRIAELVTKRVRQMSQLEGWKS
jgi:hypothetical protein